MGDAAAVCIEKFSIFGSRARSLKYKGTKKKAMRSHVIVLANCFPIPQIAYRDVVHFDIQK